ncbi:hypothetical protein I317_00009 [Kwoniella heveanensis CBS 569]|uniref:DUF427 domain-containing protein n=1 Tax=Kwoniella heveanensis BCC8398 TaxID=1296120 RepID=A0A1B9H1Y4_9TREE|nr:hypothetical protein I316_01173 [Kwoniella heveanensis BCC8398]OCF45923.1 hypothetical protein I317_00009 [Kwoniella heveanensis CBS 569]
MSTSMSTSASASREAIPLAPRKAEEDVWKYPRPPALQRTPNRLRVVWTSNQGEETTVADTTEGYRVLETTHPPTYYFPPSAIKVPLELTAKQTYCEWKGRAAYHTFHPHGGGQPIVNRIWSYPAPTDSFVPLKDHFSFYASTGTDSRRAGGRWQCFVDDEEVGVQEGDFYGGWITSNIKGKMKGGECCVTSIMMFQS